MPNEMTPLEAAEKLESIAENANGIEPERYGTTKLVDVTFHVPGDIKVLRYAASYLRKIAAGEYKQVVRCGQCKNCTLGKHENPMNAYCEELERPCFSIDFCGLGERKDVKRRKNDGKGNPKDWKHG